MDTPDAVVRRLRPASPLPFVVLAVLLFLQLISPSNAWSWPLAGLGVLIGVSYYWARSLRNCVTGSRRLVGTWVVAGDELNERFTLANTAFLPAVWARVRDHSEVPGYHADRVETLDGNAQRSWDFTGVCQRRGVFRLGPWDVQMADPFGFFEVLLHFPETNTIMVYPRASYLPELELPRGGASGRARSLERSTPETITIAEVRDYRPGDSLRRVHWPSSAHHDRLLVREFEREPTGDLWLIVDMDATVQAGREAEATQEYAVILAASLAAQLLRGGERRAVGLLVSGGHPALLSPARGQAQQWQIMRALAEAEPALATNGGLKVQNGQAAAPRVLRSGLSRVLEDLGSSLGSGRTLVVITPSQDPGWVGALLPLMSRGNAPTALLLDATTFDPPNGDAVGLANLRSMLEQQHIPTYVLAQGFPFRPIERIRRRRRVLQTLSGTGRVIAQDIEEEV